MSNFITSAEVVSIAFERSVSASLIPAIYITAAEHAHLRPALGNDFYDRLNVSSGLTAYEDALKLLLKDALAFWVKYECLPHIGVQIETGGLKVSNVYQGENVTDKQRGEIRSATLDMARKLFTVADRYMYDNDTNLPYWSQGASLSRRTSTNDGGLIIPARKVAYKVDPYAG